MPDGISDENDDCALAVLSKISAVAAVAFNAATAEMFTTQSCAMNVINVIKQLLNYFRFVQTSALQGDVEHMLAVGCQSNVGLVDLQIAIYARLGMSAPKKLVWSGCVVTIVENIVKQVDMKSLHLLKIAANTSCGYKLKQLTDRVSFIVSDIRNKTPNAAKDDVRVAVSKSSLALKDIPTVTNNCMKEMLGNKTKQTAFETRDLLRKTMKVIIDQLVDTIWENVAENDYLLEVANFGLVLGPDWCRLYGISICSTNSRFLGEIDDGNLYDALGNWTVDEAFAGSYGTRSKKGDGVVRIIFESTDKEDVTVVVHSGDDDYVKVEMGAGDTVTWEYTVPGYWVFPIQIVVHCYFGSQKQKMVAIWHARINVR
ncbi:hypothetical protein PHMEG_00029755 [Phytophthora megakarya]|uniref:Jacalin-type lectin domain-containing protein n=1 Tax=Phytophthora megakarya TaxID=4795 RepID=A0A225V1F7_9STRA|nr:hypothetical protein PHMEG_00029755 [Phytophthora megakarya]